MATPLPPSIKDRRGGDRVAGKVAIVTGGNAGVGRAAAELLAREGARVVVAARTAATGEETVRLIEQAGGEAAFVRTDVSREEDCVRLVAETVRRFGGLDVLVNAAIYPRSTLTETTVAFWREVMATNLEGPFVLCREAVPHMVAGGGGSIVNVGSGNARGGAPNLTAYSVSKGGLWTLTRNVAGAFRGQNVRANYLNPGWNITETEKRVQALEGHDEAWIAAAVASSPNGRASDPSDAAYAILWLASDESIFVNGSVVNTDGGGSLGGGFRVQTPAASAPASQDRSAPT
jgi:NAD(P)-dependent dehydrogenase (short-subunit alcohol dehydrogenase family)